jgi:hypothetical protein
MRILLDESLPKELQPSFPAMTFTPFTIWDGLVPRTASCLHEALVGSTFF